MFVRALHLENVKCFEELTLSFTPSQSGQGGWYVLLGDNGTGKSTILKAIALALAGRERTQALLSNATGWVRNGESLGACMAQLLPEQQPGRARGHQVEYQVTSGAMEVSGHGYVSRASVVWKRISDQTAKRLYPGERPGFVLAGYGPFRRLGRRSPLVITFPSMDEPFLGLFSPASITKADEWLQTLDYAAMKSNSPDRARQLDAVKFVINQLLPDSFQVQSPTVDTIPFEGPQGSVPLQDLSDGYQTMFALAVDLLRRCTEAVTPGESIFAGDDNNWHVTVPGVVLIDELEAHLHPRWQREVGNLLRRMFPRIQFVVSTHSPFVAQEATEDGIFVLEQRPGQSGVTVNNALDSLRGFRAEQILSSPAFGLRSTRDVMTESLMQEHAALQARSNVGVDLTDEESRRLAELKDQLRRVLPPPGDLPGESRK